MLQRVVPHLATALAHWGEEQEDAEYACQALSVLARMVLSEEGIKELLAHPLCHSAFPIALDPQIYL